MRWFFERSSRDRSALRQLYPELIDITWLDARDAVQSTAHERPPEAARALGRWLARNGADTGPVNVGLWLLTEAGTAEDRELISTLGLVDAVFNPAAVRALRASQPDPDRAVYAMARRLSSWGLVYAVEDLKGTTDPEIKRWMVRDVADWGLIYYCDILAVTGDLLSALRDGPVDDELLDNAGRILTSLCDPNVQTAGIDDYADGRAVLTLHRRHLATASKSLNRLVTLIRLDTSVRDGVAARLDWQPGEREALLTGYRDLIGQPLWADVIRGELRSQSGWRRQVASQHARRVGIDIIRLLLDNLVSETPDARLSWNVLAGCDGDELIEAVEILRGLLPRRPPRKFRWTVPHQVLSAILPRLGDSPGLGDDLIDYAAASGNGGLQREARAARREPGPNRA